MEKIWISTLVGALAGGLIGSTCVLILSAPLWSLIVTYPLVGAFASALIYGIWSRSESKRTAISAST